MDPRRGWHLTKQGALVQDLGEAWLAEIDADGEGDGEEARTLRSLQAAALTWRIAFGPRAGHKVVTRRGAPRREAATGQRLCADIDGFSLHAAVRCEAHERDRLEDLCRYLTRPELSDERLQLDAAGQVVLELKTPLRDGTTHLVMSPLVFLQRLAALVPRPRLHLIRFQGVVAPNARLRAQVVPQGPAGEEAAQEEAVVEGAAAGDEQAPARTARIGWARLRARVFDIDVRRCPICGGGDVKIIAAILARAVIEKILRHLGLDPRLPPRAPARPVRHHAG